MTTFCLGLIFFILAFLTIWLYYIQDTVMALGEAYREILQIVKELRKRR